MSDEGGVWRTIGGRRVFIKDGDDLATAMKNSGKFGNKEISEQGNSNRKEVKEKIQSHIMDYYENEQEFVEQMEAMKDGRHVTPWSWGEALAEGGNYLIYTQDMNDFLDELKINPKGKKFSDDKVFKTYTSLIGRESARLYEKYKK